MRSMFFAVASLALLAACACAPVEEDVIQHIPQKVEGTPSATGSGVAPSGAAAESGSEHHARARRDIGGQESDLLPSPNQNDASPFGETSNLMGRGGIRVLPAYLG
ncbi:hypothetical protein MSG28_008749 [Choristoneura fumiferana]|uniref:Uncharacterized protein n=1 Tax=Choristoneura fumiferana TaxID=7141 RepID=A0ACC0J7W0_CHOFU|nr:hypothetical protein MSG28_008749 [Choristoneura fumiferana]